MQPSVEVGVTLTGLDDSHVTVHPRVICADVLIDARLRKSVGVRRGFILPESKIPFDEVTV